MQIRLSSYIVTCSDPGLKEGWLQIVLYGQEVNHATLRGKHGLPIVQTVTIDDSHREGKTFPTSKSLH